MNHDFLVRHNGAATDHYWANWDLCNMASMLAIGIFNDNVTMYNEAITYFKPGVGNGNINSAIWKLYTVRGKSLGKDKRRGTIKAMLPLIFLFLAHWPRWRIIKETIFSPMNLTGYWLGASTVPNIMLETTFRIPAILIVMSRNLSSRTVPGGVIRPAWELLYAHYHDLKGLNALNMEVVIIIRHRGFDQLGYGTLTYRLK